MHQYCLECLGFPDYQVYRSCPEVRQVPHYRGSLLLPATPGLLTVQPVPMVLLIQGFHLGRRDPERRWVPVRPEHLLCPEHLAGPWVLQPR